MVGGLRENLQRRTRRVTPGLGGGSGRSSVTINLGSSQVGSAAAGGSPAAAEPIRSESQPAGGRQETPQTEQVRHRKVEAKGRSHDGGVG